MCLIVFDWRPRATDGALFTLAANRDEFLRRTADPLHWWHDAPGVLAGRDLVGGGTWLGMTRGGRFAALTNYRAPHEMRPDAPTRGTLVSAWLTGAESQPDTPLDYLAEVARIGSLYNGFNLVVGDWTRRELGWYCNRGDLTPALLPEGTHGISNAVLDTPWPKLVKKRAELARLVDGSALDMPEPLERLVAMMRDPQIARDDELPATGLPLERERALSAAFIETPDYGTRGTTAVRVSVHGARIEVEALERSDDNGSHRITRPGDFERRDAFTLAAR
ncbi:NRDE family protein [Paraburkholderia dinghuensis]|uniref:NRDE family protein n=1 Tax=Paraburkholderia dinghuensis TaxID=2305225 RepID=A0A3N6N8T7_9BURK|nr:NRDE family protein [Paraburkholderia dinghuensis]RQH07341.1 NRDE family protein [Paraburkholderia dinghuensis]